MRIIVVGAGVSGLTAANILQTHGHEVTVLEGRERIGGRTSTRRLRNGHADLGGAWIHGVRGNPLVTLFDHLDRPAHKSVSRDHPVTVTQSDGTRWSKSQRELLETIWNTYEDEVLASGEDMSVGDATEVLIERSGFDADEAMVARYVINDHEAALSIATPADRVSLAGSKEFDYLDGEDDIPDGGFATLVEALAKGLTIQTAVVVDRIEHSDNEVTVSSGEQSWTADQVVVSVPLGVLRAGTITFVPDLPTETQAAIDGLAMGDLRKLLLEFDDVYWNDDGLWLYQADDGAFPFIADFTPTAGAPILELEFGTLYGAATDNLSDEELVDRALEVLEIVFDRELPRPVAAIRSGWTHDPMSLGSYSYVPVGSTGDCFDVLAQPVGSIRLIGEATVRRFHSTVHGAYLSGRRAATELLDTDDVHLSFGPAPPAPPL